MICMTLTSKLNYLNQSLKLIESQFILIIIIILYSFTGTSVLCDPATAMDSMHVNLCCLYAMMAIGNDTTYTHYRESESMGIYANCPNPQDCTAFDC